MRNIEKVRRNQGVEFRRIVHIPNDKMLEWVEWLIDNVKMLPNYQLAYIDIDNIENPSPTTLVNCQVIDDDIVFLLEPDKNYVPFSGEVNGLYLQGKNINAYYKNYYNRLWNKLIDPNCTYGCLIKGGPDPDASLFTENKERIKGDIERKKRKKIKSKHILGEYK